MNLCAGFPTSRNRENFWVSGQFCHGPRYFTSGPEIKFCGQSRPEHRNATTGIGGFMCSDRFLCSHNDWP